MSRSLKKFSMGYLASWWRARWAAKSPRVAVMWVMLPKPVAQLRRMLVGCSESF